MALPNPFLNQGMTVGSISDIMAEMNRFAMANSAARFQPGAIGIDGRHQEMRGIGDYASLDDGYPSRDRGRDRDREQRDARSRDDRDRGRQVVIDMNNLFCIHLNKWYDLCCHRWNLFSSFWQLIYLSKKFSAGLKFFLCKY